LRIVIVIVIIAIIDTMVMGGMVDEKSDLLLDPSGEDVED
jgi:hypothetical protein